MEDMDKQKFNAKQRLEEGVSLFDLVTKCPREEGEFKIEKIIKHEFTVSMEGPEGVREEGGGGPATASKSIQGFVQEMTGKDIGRQEKGGGLTQSQSLELRTLPHLEHAMAQNSDVEAALKRISMKITPDSTEDSGRTASTHQENGGAAMPSQGSVTAETVAADLRKYTNVIVEGVAGCGKSHLLEGLTHHYGERTEVVVFHPATSYEDFVSGLRPQADGTFKGEAGVFVEMCKAAANNPEQDYLLFIDEINRANTSRVFGDLMLVLESSKRVDLSGIAKNERAALLSKRTPHTIALQTPVDPEEGGGERLRYLQVPRNLHILGTMNTTDRSVGTIDLALRRRFHWVTMHPLDGPRLRAALDSQGGDREHLDGLIQWYAATNERLQTHVGPDARLGHSYFFGADRSVADVATDLLNQLKEVVATFNIQDSKIKGIVGSGAPVGDQAWTIVLKGQGLGRRPEIEANKRAVQLDEQSSVDEGGSGSSEDVDTASNQGS